MSVDLEQYVGQRVCLALANQTRLIGVVKKRVDGGKYPFYIGRLDDDEPVDYTPWGGYYIDRTSGLDIVRVIPLPDFTLIEWDRDYTRLPSPGKGEVVYFLGGDGSIRTGVADFSAAPGTELWAPVQRPLAEDEAGSEFDDLRRQAEALTTAANELRDMIKRIEKLQTRVELLEACRGNWYPDSR